MTSAPRKIVNGVSVVICCYNSARRLPETMKHLALQNMPAAIPWEVILVNNASTDGTADVAARCWAEHGAPAPLRVLEEPTPGKSFALNTGYTAASFAILITVDDDNWLDENYLRIAFEIMNRHDRIGILGGQSSACCEVEAPDWFEDMKSYLAVGKLDCASGDITDFRPHLAGAGMVVRQSAYASLRQRGFCFNVTGPCQGKTGSEDTELCYAMALTGHRIWYDERLQFVHFIPASRLVPGYISRLTEQKNTDALWLTLYETALHNPRASAVSVYLQGVLKLGTWALKSFVKLLLGRHPFTVFKSELWGFWQKVVSLPEFLRLFRQYYPAILRLRENQRDE